MKKEELILELTDFLSEQGQWNDFIDWMGEKGYSEEEIDEHIS